MRDAAVQFVNAGYAAGKWTTWADAHLLIDEHDEEDDPTPEGMEAYSFHARDSDEEDEGGGGSILSITPMRCL